MFRLPEPTEDRYSMGVPGEIPDHLQRPHLRDVPCIQRHQPRVPALQKLRCQRHRCRPEHPAIRQKSDRQLLNVEPVPGLVGDLEPSDLIIRQLSNQAHAEICRLALTGEEQRRNEPWYPSPSHVSPSHP